MHLSSPVDDLRTKFVGQSTLHYPVTTSTMDVARRAVVDGAREGTIVIADQQTAGRGRLGRKWLSHPDNSILVSVIVYPELEHLYQLNMAAALAVAQSIERFTGLKPVIKWPNDILIEGKKVSGVLIESDIQGEHVKSAIIGIGINVNLDTSTIPDISGTATSLKETVGREVSRPNMLVHLLCEFENVYQELRLGAAIRKEWERRLETIGKQVLVKRGEILLEGCAESVNSEGSLLLRCADGSLTTVTAGDVTVKRS